MDKTSAEQIPTIEDIFAAQQRIEGKIRKTPVISEPVVNEILGCQLWLKCENLQRTGAFKFRGASNAIARLSELGVDGDVATHSSGNHGAALALAASNHGRQSWIVMPDNSVKTKVEAVERNGGNIVFCKPDQQARENGLAELVAKNCIPIPPYDHADIICGQGTVVAELLEQCTDLDIVLVPVGGGGLISGSAITAKAILPCVTVIGAEPAGAADTAFSLEQGKRVEDYPIDTIADGLRAIVGVLNFDIIQSKVDKVLTVSESGIRDGMALIWRHFRMVIEPSSATVIAAISEHPEVFANQKVAAVISGGNVDLEQLPFKP